MSSHPSGTRRRFHTERVITKRLRVARAIAGRDGLVPGRLDDEQWYLGCRRAHCGVCHPEKVWPAGRRERDEREWRHDVDGDCDRPI